ncbi:MAG: hypothetical protein ACKOEQ_09460 [Verrucomicrobiota bacterium]
MKAHTTPITAIRSEAAGIPRFSRSLQRILAVLVVPFALLMMASAVMAFVQGLGSLLSSHAPSHQALLALAATLLLALGLSCLAWSLWLGRGVPLAVRRGFLIALLGGIPTGLAWSYFTDEDITGWAMVLVVMAMSWQAIPALWGSRPGRVPEADPAG